jgi:hypothetical protein
MDDHDFAALERRLAHVEALPSSAGAGRDDVLALLSECRALRAELERLRRPPDVSGLMTEAEVDAAAAYFQDHGPLSVGEVERLFLHARTQAALIRELYGVVSDLHADDPGRQRLLERGRAEGREEAAVLLGGLDMPEAAAKVRALLTPCRPPLPPSEAEREAARLREALRAVAVADRHDAPYGALAKALTAARAALAEEAR